MFWQNGFTVLSEIPTILFPLLSKKRTVITSWPEDAAKAVTAPAAYNARQHRINNSVFPTFLNPDFLFIHTPYCSAFQQTAGAFVKKLWL